MAGDGFAYPELVQQLIELATERHAAKAAYRG
jgi:hypothetical protein